MKQFSTIQNIIHSLACSLFLLAIVPTQVHSQVSLQIGGSLVTELTQGEASSDFYYNNIHSSFSDLRVGVKEINLLARLQFPKGFSLNSRLMLGRYKGQRLRQFQAILLHASWTRKDDKLTFNLGRIQTPFGAFYDRPLPQDRIFLSPPLAFSYFTNISPYVGFSTSLWEPNFFFVEGNQDWGTPLAYELGYTQGAQLHWEPRKDTISLDIALVQASPNLPFTHTNTLHPTLMIRANFQPTYFWQQGISVSYGGFMQQENINQSLEQLGSFRQLMLGAHTSLGYSYVEWRAEVIGSWFNVPLFDGDSSAFVDVAPGELKRKMLTSLGAYTDLKVEMPFWAGAYVAYRFGLVRFGRLKRDQADSIPWDDNTFRHSIGVGIPINRSILLQSTYTIQEVSNKEWDLNSFRLALILHI